jgi:hypothetical protein
VIVQHADARCVVPVEVTHGLGVVHPVTLTHIL